MRWFKSVSFRCASDFTFFNSEIGRVLLVVLIRLGWYGVYPSGTTVSSGMVSASITMSLLYTAGGGGGGRS